LAGKAENRWGGSQSDHFNGVLVDRLDDIKAAALGAA